jgi:hypothetical protein
MRTPEWINVAVFAFLTGLAWFRRLPARRRAVVTGLGIAAISATLLAASRGAPWLRDWLPAALLLMVYWQAGRFFLRPDEALQKRLQTLDSRIVLPVTARLLRIRGGRQLLAATELAYLFCYPMVPLALGAVDLLHEQRHTDEFWAVVLASTYACYLMVPFVQTLPPRSLSSAEPVLSSANPIRRFNLWILQRASIQMNTFPSAHVAASMACAFVLMRISLLAGCIFLCIATGIALGAVFGRYHYAADAVLGILVALVATLLIAA